MRYTDADRVGKPKSQRKRRELSIGILAPQNTYIIPIETCGAFGKHALQLCAKLRKIWLTKCCGGNDSPNVSQLKASTYAYESVDPLLVSISTLLQSHNAQMILERSPLSPKLLDSEIARSQAKKPKHNGNGRPKN